MLKKVHDNIIEMILNKMEIVPEIFLINAFIFECNKKMITLILKKVKKIRILDIISDIIFKNIKNMIIKY